MFGDTAEDVEGADVAAADMEEDAADFHTEAAVAEVTPVVVGEAIRTVAAGEAILAAGDPAVVSRVAAFPPGGLLVAVFGADRVEAACRTVKAGRSDAAVIAEFDPGVPVPWDAIAASAQDVQLLAAAAAKAAQVVALTVSGPDAQADGVVGSDPGAPVMAEWLVPVIEEIADEGDATVRVEEVIIATGITITTIGI